tara:strand:+ start:6413 stop:8764 length:2352 start_codon:yes stop_codon:yes gene_type:complete
MKENEITLKSGELYILSAPPASGKSTFLKNNNIPNHMIISSDTLRSEILGNTYSYDQYGLVNEPLYNDDSSIFRILRTALQARLKEKLTTFLDATNCTDKDRKNFVKIANEYGVKSTVLIFDIDKDTCIKQDAGRLNRVGEESISRFFDKFKTDSIFDYKLINGSTKINFVHNSLPHGRFDIIGDTHGCLDEFIELTTKQLGYRYNKGELFHIEGRKLLLLGDFLDRGRQSIEMMKLAYDLQQQGHVILSGNHDNKLNNFLTSYQKGDLQLSSRSAAETAMAFMKLRKDERDKYSKFIKNLPHYVVYKNFAMLHGNVAHFDPLNTPRSFCLYGDDRRNQHNSISDSMYHDLMKRENANQYFLIRGHTPLNDENQTSVVSLDKRVAFENGAMLAIKLDQAIALKSKNTDADLKPLIIEKPVNYDYQKELEKQFRLQTMFSNLKKNKLATQKTDDTKLMTTWKYSKSVFFKQSWDKDPALLKCRGLVIDRASNIIVHPFDKVFNYGEPNHLKEETATTLPDNQQVRVIEKLNGYLGMVTKHPFKENQLLITTQGTFEEFYNNENELVKSTYAGYVRDLIDKKSYSNLMRYLSKNDVTLMFEVIHPEDKDNHIVKYDKEMEGLHLIGVRGKNFEDEVLKEHEIDAIAEEIGFRRPSHKVMSFGDAKKLVEQSEIEGYMIRTLEDEEYVCKFKTPHYLIVKFLSRMGKSNFNKMYDNPNEFKKHINVEEEFYPLIDYITKNFDRKEFMALNEDERKATVKDIIKDLRSNDSQSDIGQFIQKKNKLKP